MKVNNCKNLSHTLYYNKIAAQFTAAIREKELLLTQAATKYDTVYSISCIGTSHTNAREKEELYL